MRRLSSCCTISKFSPENKPAYVVRNGERVIVETKDGFSGVVKNEERIFEDVSVDEICPATGPIQVEGMSAGDALCVSIEKIKCGEKGVLMCSPNLGILSRDVKKSRTIIVEIRGNKAKLSRDLEVDINPHVGVIGVSPRKESYPTFYPGDFGGNMDTVEIREKSRVYLPTFAKGGMVALGDVHAAMGDGEICGTGIEVPAELTVTFSKAEGLDVIRPMIETSTEWITYAAANTLDEAAKLAASDMVRFISNSRGVDFEDAYMIASVAADLGISQVVDPLIAAKMTISKRYL